MAAHQPDNPVLRTLLDAGANFGPLDRNANPNQRGAGLLALARLGADDGALRAMAALQDASLLPAPDVAPWPPGDPWTDGLGTAQAWAPYRDLMGQWLFYEDAGDVLRQTLPRLLQGCAGHGFAGLIRSAYAVQAQSRQELVDALAFWASSHLALAPAAAPGPRALVGADPEPALRRLRAVARSGSGLDKSVQAAARDTAFGHAVAMFVPDGNMVRRLSALAAQAYAANGTDLAAQLLISARAIDVLLPFVDADLVADARRYYWHAFAALVCVAGLRDAPAPAPRSWRAIALRVRACRDPRAVCVVDSCRALEKSYGADPLWRQAATRALWP